MPPSDHTLVAAIARGLSALGMPAVSRSCRIYAARLGQGDCAQYGVSDPTFVAKVHFRDIVQTTAADAWRSDNWYRCEAQFALQPGPDFTQRDLLEWAGSFIPGSALYEARLECRQKGIRWPREYPVVERHTIGEGEAARHTFSVASQAA